VWTAASASFTFSVVLSGSLRVACLVGYGGAVRSGGAEQSSWVAITDVVRPWLR
jgi:hypothetical protein